MLSFLSILSLLAFTVNGGVIAASHHRGVRPPKLQIITASKELIQAKYSTSTDGILIVSEVSPGQDALHVSIKSNNGETMFEVNRQMGGMGLSHLSVAGEEFLVLNETAEDGRQKITVYHTPEANSKIINGREPKPFPSHELDSHTAHVSGLNAIAKLATHPQARLVKEAAVSLGDHISGRDSAAAMAFFATALRLSKLFQEQSTHIEEYLAKDFAYDEPQTRHRRWGVRWILDAISPRNSKEQCRNSGSTCPRGRCPRGSKCRGLCGPGCTCWSFVCGDCCWNRGCDAHDRICTPGGRHSVQCLATAPIGLACS